MKFLIVALLAGAATVFGFSPFDVFPVPFLTLAVLFWLWRRSHSPWAAMWQGLAWGMGCFLAGVSWVYVSLHDVGGMPLPLALLATLGFCGILAVFPAIAGYAFRRLATGGAADPWLLAGCWTLAEWLRGWVLSGLPWLAIGYSQTPPSPLAGFVPLIGVYGIGFLVAAVPSCLTFFWRKPWAWAACALVLAAGQGLRTVEWTAPRGEPMRIALLQGNIPQSLKWDPANLRLSLETYLRLAEENPADLTVLPETAIPLMFDQIPQEVLRGLGTHGDVLIGSPLRRPDGGYTNSAVLLSRERGAQTYSKMHLVPFGEYVPPGFAWFFGLVNIPMSNFSPGPAGQAALLSHGQRIMPNICYEDLFGEELLPALPEAGVLINLSNTAWFGDSLAQPQHMQIARMRALETGRPVLRAANTGITLHVAPDGILQASLPAFVPAALVTSVRSYEGMTPYARFGNAIVLLLAVLACLPALISCQRSARSLR